MTPTIWLGTSAGSINAVLWGAAAHRDAATAAEEVLDVWRQMSDEDVYRPLLPFPLARTGLQFAAGALLGVGSGPTSLLDTAPLRRTAADELKTGQLAANIARGVLKAVGVVATRIPAQADSAIAGAASGRSVLFLDEHSAGSYHGDPCGLSRGPGHLAPTGRRLVCQRRGPAQHATTPGGRSGGDQDPARLRDRDEPRSDATSGHDEPASGHDEPAS